MAAATIVSSVIASQTAQRDGRISVHEIHTDSLGVLWDHFYLALATDNLATALAAYAVILAGNLTQTEIANNITAVSTIGSLATPTFVYSTPAQNATALRAFYATTTQAQAVMIGDYLNTLSSAQLQAAFGLTAGQVTTLQTNKLQPAATLAASIRATAGQ